MDHIWEEQERKWVLGITLLQCFCDRWLGQVVAVDTVEGSSFWANLGLGGGTTGLDGG
jgi:hypothetical protein